MKNIKYDAKGVKDITGLKIDKLTAIKFAYTQNNKAQWWFKCDCGKELIRSPAYFKTSSCFQSCGCERKWNPNIKYEKAKNLTPEQKSLYKRMRQTWYNMLGRCEDPQNDAYGNYGGRGIKVCDAWKNLDNFIEHFGLIPANLTLERIDVNGNYEPTNVTLIPLAEQAKNKTNTHWITYNYETICMEEFIRKYAVPLNLNVGTVKSRLAKGMSAEEALKPARKISPKGQKSIKPKILTGKEFKKYPMDGKMVTLSELVSTKSIHPYETVIYRLKKNWSLEDALYKPKKVYNKYRE